MDPNTTRPKRNYHGHYHIPCRPYDRFQKASFFVRPPPIFLPPMLAKSPLPAMPTSPTAHLRPPPPPPPHRLETWRQLKAGEILQFASSMLLPKKRWLTQVLRVHCRYAPEQIPDVRVFPEDMLKVCVLCGAVGLSTFHIHLSAC
jgi:hypothetical protein